MSDHSPILVGLAFVTLVAALTAFGRRLPVPAPVLQVLAGVLVAAIPGVQAPELEPDLVFFVFLPPILWAAALFTSLTDFRANLRPIGWLAVGLVVATTAGVAVAARFLFPDMPWAVAVALGAIVSPPDAVAAAAVVSRLPVPRRVIVILEGESLVNDASALVLYRSAVAAAVTGVFSISDSILHFFLDAALGVAIGLAVAWLIAKGAKRTRDDLPGILLTLAGPYAAWMLAEELRASAVLACVAGGLYLRQQLSIVVGPRSRVQARAIWDLLVFVLNAMIFVLLGMEFTTLFANTTLAELPSLLYPGLVISVVMVVVRLLWVPLATWLPRRMSPAFARREGRSDHRAVALVAWTSMRGILSLATALALPLTLADGTPFPYRQEVLYITMCVILFTLVVQGCTLAPIIRRMAFKPDLHHRHQEQFARLEAVHCAQRVLEAAVRDGTVTAEDAAWLRAELNEREDRYLSSQGVHARDVVRARMRDAERRLLVRMRDEGAISDDVLNELEEELDLDAMRGQRHPH